LCQALVPLTCGKEKDKGVSVARKGCEEPLMPERPYLGRGNNEGLQRPWRGELAQARIERAEQARRDDNVIHSLRSGDTNRGHEVELNGIAANIAGRIGVRSVR